MISQQNPPWTTMLCLSALLFFLTSNSPQIHGFAISSVTPKRALDFPSKQGRHVSRLTMSTSHWSEFSLPLNTQQMQQLAGLQRKEVDTGGTSVSRSRPITKTSESYFIRQADFAGKIRA